VVEVADDEAAVMKLETSHAAGGTRVRRPAQP
jgi:hypothetical protein